VGAMGQHGRIAADDRSLVVHDFIGQWAAEACLHRGLYPRLGTDFLSGTHSSDYSLWHGNREDTSVPSFMGRGSI